MELNFINKLLLLRKNYVIVTGSGSESISFWPRFQTIFNHWPVVYILLLCLFEFSSNTGI